MADDAGSILLRAGLVGDEQLLAARRRQTAEGGTLGEHLVLAGLIDDEELTAFYRNRLLVPRVNPNDLTRIPDKVTALIPPDMAAEFRVVPVYLDREQNLTVAMSDPSLTHAVDELGFFTGAYVVRAVATQRQIAWCLARYYGVVTALGESLLEPADEAASEAADEAADEAAERTEIVMEAEEPDEASEMFSGASDYQPSHFDEDTGPTRRIKPKPKPKRRREATPPELAPRAGEVEVRTGRRRKPDSTPGILVDPAALAPPGKGEAVPEVVDGEGTESRPILLRTRSGSTHPVPGPDEEVHAPGEAVPEATKDEDDVVLLVQPKRAGGRRARRTDLGLGALGADKPSVPGARARTSRDTDLSPPPRMEEGVGATGNSSEDWGPPGTTIPPAYLGAMPGTYQESDPGGSIPIPMDDDQSVPNSIIAAAKAHLDADRPAVEAPATAPEKAPRESEPATSEPPTSADLEESSLRLVETLRRLDRASSRDEVIEELIDHLRDICVRVAFFAARRGELAGFAVRGPGADERRISSAVLSLEVPSTLRDAVRARLPYHGPVGDDATRGLLARAFDAEPEEILAVPVTVRDRVVGVLYGDGKRRPLFSAHLAAISHAAGLALERILKKQRDAR